jgi:hypothetical protein
MIPALKCTNCVEEMRRLGVVIAEIIAARL